MCMLNKMRVTKKEWFVLALLFVVTVTPRFLGLGYSNFYGDETKTFYWDKTVPAKQFLLNQRKGPVQFLVVWVTQQILLQTNIPSSNPQIPNPGFHEFYTRLPFAIAGTLAVFALYFWIRKIYNQKVAALAAFLLSLTGFYIAFSRTIQYQSFLLLFGFLSNLCFSYALDSTEEVSTKKSKLVLILSGAFLGLAFLSHWDAAFLAIPIFYGFLKQLIPTDPNLKSPTPKRFLKKILPQIFLFLIPLLLILSTFYLPYFLNGYFTEHTAGYISRRLNGGTFARNNSLYTMLTYTPFLPYYLLLSFSFVIIGSLIPATKESTTNQPPALTQDTSPFMLWLIIGLLTFELLFSNPGTHIHNYLITAIILAALGLQSFYETFASSRIKQLLLTVLATLTLGFIFLCDLFIYVPQLHLGYPWKDVSLGRFHLEHANKEENHLFLYGFPYNRQWKQVRDYLYSLEGVRTVYTNDNATVAEHYLRAYDVVAPGSNFLPQYYVLVQASHEFKFPSEEFLKHYVSVKAFSPPASLLDYPCSHCGLDPFVAVLKRKDLVD
ncbi:phospholipid carrier-dependent glycosyltransferase [candidate division WWE3 bacterium]|nr:phospholipid carrier-dependent glycosyltransferase [candidate division WWE3 bacterium]